MEKNWGGEMIDGKGQESSETLIGQGWKKAARTKRDGGSLSLKPDDSSTRADA